MCAFYRKALRWYVMEVIFLVSLLQTSNKYKSTAIFVLPTFCFHFFVVFLTVSLPPPPSIKLHFGVRIQSRLPLFLGIHRAPLPLWLLGLRAPLSLVGRIRSAWERSMRAHSELWPTWQNFARWLIENWWTSIPVHISVWIKALLERGTYKTGNHNFYLLWNFNQWGKQQTTLGQEKKTTGTFNGIPS